MYHICFIFSWSPLNLVVSFLFVRCASGRGLEDCCCIQRCSICKDIGCRAVQRIENGFLLGCCSCLGKSPTFHPFVLQTLKWTCQDQIGISWKRADFWQVNIAFMEEVIPRAGLKVVLLCITWVSLYLHLVERDFRIFFFFCIQWWLQHQDWTRLFDWAHEIWHGWFGCSVRRGESYRSNQTAWCRGEQLYLSSLFW